MTSTDSSTEKKTVTEAFELVTGFDEIAVEKAFKCTDIDALQAMRRLRALVFLDKRRDGMDDKKAYEYAMGLTTKEVGDHFADEGDDETEPAAPGEALSPAGEDDSLER